MTTALQGTPLLTSLKIQGRVIGALVIREMLTRYGRHNIGFLWLFVEPMIFTLGIITLWTLARIPHGNSISLVAFAVTGYSTVLMWRNMPARTIGAVEPNLALMYHRNVKLIDVFIARLLLEGVGASISFLALGTVFTLAGWMQLPQDIFKVLVAWILLAWFGSAFAIFMGSWSERTDLVEKLWPPFTYILFPLSGAGFMVDWLPPKMQEFILYLPMIHGIEMLREGYFGAAVRAHYDAGYLIIVNLCITFAGLSQTRYIGRYVEPQ